MANLLKGVPVSNAIKEKCIRQCEVLKNKGIIPTLAILRVGENQSDLSYERGAVKRCNEVGVNVKQITLPLDISQNDFMQQLDSLNNDSSVHGILMFRPLPSQLDNELARVSIKPEKDIDGCTDLSLAGVFTDQNLGFPPCTAQAVMEILNYYQIPVTGKKIAVIGRSLVIGKPVSMMLMKQGATVTICHSKTKDIPSITKDADIVVVAIGKMESINQDFFSNNQTVIDVGISWNDSKNKLCGDVDFDTVEPLVSNITPVPGGVGAVTTSVLVSHVIEAAKRISK